MSTIICHYAIAILLTIVLELTVAWLLGYRRRIELSCVVAVNVLTHPAATILVWTVALWRPSFMNSTTILLLEILIVAVEWLLMCFALPRRSRAGLFFLSLLMNGVSYLIGFFIPGL